MTGRFKMRRVISIALLLMCVAATHAQTESIRIERLAGLAKVWNVVKFYHPFLADRKIDWDKALIEAIPKVNAARTDSEYSAAIGSMLDVLRDPVTKVAGAAPPVQTPSDASPLPTPVVENDGIIRINLTAAGRALFDRTGKSQMVIPAIESTLPTAKGIVIDARSTKRLAGDDDDAYFTDQSMYFLLPMLIKETVNLDRLRYRSHDGYAPQDGSSTSGGYFSSVVTEMPRAIIGKGSKAVPITFIVNDSSYDESEIWDALQSRHLASVIYDGTPTRTFGVTTAPIKLPGNVTANIRTMELAGDRGPAEFVPDHIVPQSSEDAAMKLALSSAASPTWASPEGAATPPSAQSEREEAYADMTYPSNEYRLLGLFRFWGVIDTFYPYKDLIADNWGTVLQRHIPKFESAKNALEYQTAVYQLATELHDSHGFVRGTNAFDENYGMHITPVYLRTIEGKPTVAKLLDDKSAFKVGDVIEAVDGKSVAELTSRMKELFVASTPQAFGRVVAGNLLRGQKDSVAHVAIDRDGKAMTIDAPRTTFRWDPKVFAAAERAGPDFGVLPSGYGYVDLARLTNDEVDDMFKKIAGTKGVIFDMRGYPNGTAWSITPRLTSKVEPEAALFSRPVVSGRILTDHDLALARLTFPQRLPPARGDMYKGKVVVLIDESALSQAEHTCLFFETATDATFIGSPTTGANGDVSNTVLPGGIYVNFSGHSVKHIDGRQLQRVGIQPTLRVQPTIAGIKAGRDEVLDAAIKYLKKTVK
jgi:C-terminal processing protease CtpA/Prc